MRKIKLMLSVIAATITLVAMSVMAYAASQPSLSNLDGKFIDSNGYQWRRSADFYEYYNAVDEGKNPNQYLMMGKAGSEPLDAPEKVMADEGDNICCFSFSAAEKTDNGTYYIRILKAVDSGWPEVISATVFNNRQNLSKGTMIDVQMWPKDVAKLTTGIYYAEVSNVGRSFNSGYLSSPWTSSKQISYVKPDKKIDAPTNVKMVDNMVTFTLPKVASGGYAGWYCEIQRFDEATGKWGKYNKDEFIADETITIGMYRTTKTEKNDKENYELDLSPYPTFSKDGKFRVRVMSLSEDISELTDSDFTDWVEQTKAPIPTVAPTPTVVPTPTVAPTPESAKEALNSSNISNTEKIEAINKSSDDEVKALLNDSTSAKKIEAVEDSVAKERNITVEKPVVATELSEKIDSNKISAVGLVTGLDTAATNKTVGIKINNVTEVGVFTEDVNSGKYSNVVEFDMKVMVGGEEFKKELESPAKITVPVPAGLNADAIIILHKTSSGVEVINTKNNGDGTVSFFVKSFSPFAIAEEVVKNEVVEAFVSRLYSLVLGREADAAGLNDWTVKLVKKARTGSEVALGFFASQEMIDRNLPDEDYVKICYRTMLNREADEGGLTDWISRLENGISRVEVLYGFTNSTEFDNICNQYGIERGTLKSTENRDQNLGITSFVARCYTKALGRKFDVDGLNDWSGQILNAADKKQKAEAVASDGFFHSEEFGNKNTSNGEYVEILYRTFLGREYDEAGYADWVGKLDAGVSRDEVLYGFSRSQEFSNIMASYGL